MSAAGRFGLLETVERVRVGSANEPKVAAARAALQAYLPQVHVEGAAVDSGVPEQPVGFEEISQGASNRARRAWSLAGASPPDLAIGIEDGLVELDLGSREAVLNIGCACVTDGTREALGFSSAFAYPPQCAGPAIAERAPIGDLFDRLWAARSGPEGSAPDVSGPALPSARTSGNIGKLSLGVLPRSEYARQAVLCALVQLLHPDLYFETETDPSVPDRGAV